MGLQNGRWSSWASQLHCTHDLVLLLHPRSVTSCRHVMSIITKDLTVFAPTTTCVGLEHSVVNGAVFYIRFLPVKIISKDPLSDVLWRGPIMMSSMTSNMYETTCKCFSCKSSPCGQLRARSSPYILYICTHIGFPSPKARSPVAGPLQGLGAHRWWPAESHPALLHSSANAQA